MAIKTKEEILEQVRSLLNESTSDEALSLIEDIDDTVSDFENRTKENTDWKEKYEENDATWRKRYHDRFFNHSADNDDNPDDDESNEDKPKTYTYDELFTKE